MNVLITALSLSTASKEAEYILIKEGRECRVTGCHTNDPVPKALQSYLQHQRQQLDVIIVLCTAATLTADDNGISVADRFGRSLVEAGITATMHTICLHESANARDIYNTSMELLQICRAVSEPCLYIDTTGGFRDAMMFLISMMQLLKEENIHIADVLYTVYDRNAAGPHPIVSRMDAYQVYDLIGGYEALNVYGDPRKLRAYYKNRNISAQAQKILDRLQSVYDEMRLCRVTQSNKALLDLSVLLKEYVPAQSTFDRVVELATAKYGDIQKGFSDRDFIHWYYDHGYVPQTLAFFYETLPANLAAEGILYPSESVLEEVREKYLHEAWGGDDMPEELLRRQEYHQFINRYFRNTYNRGGGTLDEGQHAELIMNSVDGCNSFLSPTVDRATLTALLKEYFFLRSQRNSVLHVGSHSISYNKLVNHITEAIRLMDQVFMEAY